MKTIAFDIDDASIVRTKYGLLRRLIDRYPDIKITLFFIPFDYEMEMAQLVRIYKESRLVELKDLLKTGNVELVPHGLTHMPEEFLRADKHTIKLSLSAIEDVLGSNGLPYVKGFKAPYWLYNKNLVEVLDENGWWMAINRDDPKALKTERFYKYSHSIHEPFWKSESDVLKLHGHMLGSENDLEEHFLNLYKIPLEDVEFKFASELVEGREKNGKD